jgi:hypothetical protein
MADDGTIKKDQIIDPEAKAAIDEVTNSIRILLDQFTAFTNTINTSTKAISEQTKSISDLGKIQKETEDQTKKLETLKNKLAASEAKLTEEVIRANMSKKEYAEKTKQEAILNNENAGALEKLLAQHKLLTAEKKKLKESDENYSATLKKINKDLDDNIAKQRTMDSGDEKRIHNIGQYTKSLKEGAISFAKWGLAAIGATSALNVIGKSISWVMNSSEPLKESWERTTAGISAGLSVLGQEFINMGESATKGSEQGISALNKLTNNASAGLASLIKYPEQLIGININLADSYRNKVKKAMDDASLSAIQYTAMLQELQKAETKLIAPRAKALADLNEARAKGRDENIPLEERIKLLQEAKTEEEKQTNEAIALQDKRVASMKKLKKSFIDTGRASQWGEESQHEKDLQEAIAKTYELKTESLSKTRRATNELRTLEKEQIKNEQDGIKATLAIKENELQQSLSDMKESTGLELDLNASVAQDKLDAYEKSVKGSKLEAKEKQKIIQELWKYEKEITDANIKYNKQEEKDAEGEAMQIYQNLVNAYKLKNDNIKAQDKDLSIAQIDENEKTLKHLINVQRDFLIEKHNLGAISDKEYENSMAKLATDEVSVKKQAQDLIFAYQEKRLRDREMLERKFSDTARHISEQATKDINGYYEILTARLKQQENKQLSNTKLTEVEKNKIKREYAIKEAEINRKQAILDKVTGVFTSGINTATAITRALKDFPAPYNFIIAAAIGVLGAIQIGEIAAKPLPDVPSFKKGGKTERAGIFTLHGKEMVTLPSGEKFLTLGGVDDPINTVLPAQTKITSNEVLREQILNMPKARTKDEVLMQNQLLSEVVRELKKDKPMVNFNVDADGFAAYKMQREAHIKYIDKRFRGKI